MAEATPTGTGISHARVLKIALPIMLSNVTVPLLGLVDTGVVGQLGEAAPIGAVGVGAVVLSAVYWVFGFLRMGTTGLAAQARGAGDRGEVAALLTRVLMIGLVAGAVLIALQALIFAGAFAVSPASAEVEGMARAYMAIRIWSAPAAIAIYGITGWLIAGERTPSVMALQIWMNGANIVLDVVFVLGLGWGVEGVALATFLAEWSGLALGLWLCRGAFRDPAWRAWDMVFDRARLWHMAAVNSDIMVRSVLLTASFTAFLLLGAHFGDETLAANQILLQFLHLMAYGLDGFALAAETLVGQAMGAQSTGRLRSAALVASQWALGLSVAAALGFLLAGNWIVALMTTAEGVRAVAHDFLPWVVLAPLLAAPSFMLDGIFVGATRSRDMRNMMILSAGGFAVALWVLLPIWGNHGLWAAMMVFYTLRAVTLGARYPALERAVG